jgi:hypothetical protein
MAIGKLEYNLNDQDDQIAHLRAVKSLDLAMALWDMDGYLRSETKYAPDSIKPEVYDTLQSVRDKLHEIMNKHSIDLDELIN